VSGLVDSVLLSQSAYFS